MQSDLFRVGFFDSFEQDISWQRKMAEIVTQFSCRIMFPLSIGTRVLILGGKLLVNNRKFVTGVLKIH